MTHSAEENDPVLDRLVREFVERRVVLAHSSALVERILAQPRALSRPVERWRRKVSRPSAGRTQDAVSLKILPAPQWQLSL